MTLDYLQVVSEPMTKDIPSTYENAPKYSFKTIGIGFSRVVYT